MHNVNVSFTTETSNTYVEPTNTQISEQQPPFDTEVICSLSSGETKVDIDTNETPSEKAERLKGKVKKGDRKKKHKNKEKKYHHNRSRSPSRDKKNKKNKKK